MTAEERDRFNSKVKKIGDCLVWQAYKDRDGYGTFYFRKKGRRAHRVAYYMYRGDIPEGYVIDHICKNPACVSIEHLRCITSKENTLVNSRSVAAINAMKTHCKYGHEFDRFYGKQRYCSICQSNKTKRLRKKWATQADSVKC